MNPKDPEIPITPGIREALHPGLGNGAALEPDQHAFLLRVPDPTKLLESFLEPGTEPLKSSSESTNVPTTRKDRDQDGLPEDQAEMTKTEEDSDGNASTEIDQQKAIKPGKRLKKAIKSTSGKAPDDQDRNTMESKTESTLSPFTLWLKGLSGSEYVHPYDDDFALRQEPPAAGEGISETYADLLAAQGYKDQAIEMYKRLMEKYPEKSGFFAAKIEALS